MSSSTGFPIMGDNFSSPSMFVSSSNQSLKHSSSTSTTHSARKQSRRSGPHINPFGGADRMNARENNNNDHGVNDNARLMRQQFRQKCQEAMARDRNRDRERKLQKSRESGSSAINSDSDGYTTYGSENNLSSDRIIGSEIDQMDEEEEVSIFYIYWVLMMRSGTDFFSENSFE